MPSPGITHVILNRFNSALYSFFGKKPSAGKTRRFATAASLRKLIPDEGSMRLKCRSSSKIADLSKSSGCVFRLPLHLVCVALPPTMTSARSRTFETLLHSGDGQLSPSLGEDPRFAQKIGRTDHNARTPAVDSRPGDEMIATQRARRKGLRSVLSSDFG
jgi:hypothetical protein